MLHLNCKLNKGVNKMKIQTCDGYVENPNDHPMDVGFTFWKCYVPEYNHDKHLPKFDFIVDMLIEEQLSFGC